MAGTLNASRLGEVKVFRSEIITQPTCLGRHPFDRGLGAFGDHALDPCGPYGTTARRTEPFGAWTRCSPDEAHDDHRVTDVDAGTTSARRT